MTITNSDDNGGYSWPKACNKKTQKPLEQSKPIQCISESNVKFKLTRSQKSLQLTILVSAELQKNSC